MIVICVKFKFSFSDIYNLSESKHEKLKFVSMWIAHKKIFKCEIKNTEKIQIDNRISNKVKIQE